MKRTALISLILLSGSLSLSGQDTLQVSRRVRQELDPVLHIGTDATEAHSAAAFLFSPLPTLVDASLGFQYRDEEVPSVLQEGDGLLEGAFRAQAFRRLSEDDAVQGGASYRRGVRRNVRWNNTSDFDLLFPYVTADSVGGDLQTETYAFYGKYARRAGQFFWGAEGDYRACHEYRTVDPRPRNITSDFTVHLTGGLVLGCYAADLSAAYRRYHQQQSVEYVNPLGAKAPQLHLTGLGSHYARFQGSGAYLNTRYRGNGYSLSAGVRPVGTGGISAGGSYTLFDAVQHLVNQNEAPFTELRLQDVKAYAGWRSDPGAWHEGVEAGFSYRLREGLERVIDNVATGIYDDIYTLSMYHGRTWEGSLKGAVTRESARTSLSLMPRLEYLRENFDHRFPERKLAYSHLEGELGVRWIRVHGRWTALAGGGWAYRKALGGEYLIPAEYTLENLLAAYAGEYAVLTDGAHTFSANLRLAREMGRGTAGYLDLSGSLVRYSRGFRTLQGGLTIGFNF